jgi:hypothetical protein
MKYLNKGKLVKILFVSRKAINSRFPWLNIMQTKILFTTVAILATTMLTGALVMRLQIQRAHAIEVFCFRPFSAVSKGACATEAFGIVASSTNHGNSAILKPIHRNQGTIAFSGHAEASSDAGLCKGKPFVMQQHNRVCAS